MVAVSTPMPSEDWADDDFDIPDGLPLLRKQPSRQGKHEDWDADMNDAPSLGSTASNPVLIDSDRYSSMRIIRPALSNISKSDDDEDEGVSTIKVGALLQVAPKGLVDEDDFDDAFSFPDEMTKLSLAPLSLHHQSSKSSFEWGGDKDQTTSSQSSDAYSSLGFDASPMSNSTNVSNETDDSDSNDDMDGLVLPDDLFESKQAGRHLTKILAVKKAATEVSTQVRGPRRSTEEDFEMGLVIDDDFELSPSRLKQQTQKQKRHNPRSTSLPIQRSMASLRPPSRLRGERSLAVSPPPIPKPKRSQTFQTLSPASAGPSTLLPAKPGSLRGQKSHTGLKPPSPTNRKLSRKASLSSLLEGNQSASSSNNSVASSSKSRYEEPTAASRAKSKTSMSKASMSRLHYDEYNVPPTRPSTPSSSTAALRLTMPTQGSRLKSRPPLSSVWAGSGSPASPAFPSGSHRTSSPLPPRPPSSLARSRQASSAGLGPVQQMMRPQKSRVFGDGSELDNIDDLSTDRDKESRFDVHVQNKNRIPGGSYSNLSEKGGTLRRKARQNVSSPTNSELSSSVDTPPTGKRTSSSRTLIGPASPSKRKRTTGTTRKRPTLIRQMGQAGGPKVIGDMKWNPKSLRWEGNENVLREFDAVLTSTRPALITLPKAAPGSPAGSFASGVRRVGNMIFDPARLCWISALAPDEDEPDVFADMADDEGDDWDARGDTIKASLQTGAIASGRESRNTSHLRAPSPSKSMRSMTSESGSDTSVSAPTVFNIDDALIKSCRAAEERHRTEMKGWKFSIPRSTRSRVSQDEEHSHLFEIRALATRQY